MVFKYERLPNLCYWCRCLDHDNKDCELWIQSKGSLQKNQQQYGPSIRAPPFKPFNNSVIHVPGFYENRSSHWRKGRSDTVVDDPIMTMRGGDNQATTEIHTNMEIENLGKEFNVDNSSNSNFAPVTYVTSPITIISQELSDLISQNQHSFNSDVTNLDGEFFFQAGGD